MRFSPVKTEEQGWRELRYRDERKDADGSE
jgi:hypothetical protein